MPIWIYVLPAFASSLILQIILMCVSKRFSNTDWFFYYFLFLTLIAGLLALQWYLPIYPWLPRVLVVGLLCSVLMRPRSLIGQLSLKWTVVPAFIFLAIDLLYAAFPAYRYDQLSYHLLVNKVIGTQGTLIGPKIQDHFMTGIYEYLFTMPRSLWNNDFFVICFANCFSLLTFLLLALGLSRLYNPAIGTSFGFLYTAVVLFFAPEHEAIINAKPDYILAFVTAALLMVLARLKDSRQDSKQWFWLSFLALVPLAYKITWVHGLLSLTPVALIAIRRHFSKISWLSLFSGIALAVVFVLIFFSKNYHFYGNPVHPAQTPWFNASFSEEQWSYWLSVSGKAKSIDEYGAMLLQLVIEIPMRYSFTIMLIAILFILALPHRKMMVKEFFLPISFLFVFWISWPLLYKPTIFSRFVTPAYGAFSLLLLYTSSYAYQAKPRSTSIILLCSIICFSGADRHLIEISKGMLITPQQYFLSTKNPLRFQEGYFVINEDLKRVSGAAPLSAMVLSDDNNGYFSNAGVLDVRSFHNLALFKEFEVQNPTHRNDLPGYLAYLNIQYAYSVNNSFETWPVPFEDIRSYMESTDDPRIWKRKTNVSE